MPCHIVFNIKMDFRCKAQLVAGGLKTNPLNLLTYSRDVSQDSIRIAYLIAALNGLDTQSIDISNAYINPDSREKVNFIKETLSRLYTALKQVKQPGKPILPRFFIPWALPL
jgi:hypothetical protein